MKIHFYRLLSGAALLCIMLANKPCLADSSGYDINPNPFSSAGQGTGSDPSTGLQTLNRGNTNVPFEEYSNFTPNLVSQDPYDKIPIDRLNNVDVGSTGMGSGTQIYDYSATNNGAQAQSNAGYTGTWTQTPIGRVSAGANPYQPVGLQSTSTAIQAGAVPGSPGIYNFTVIPMENKYNYSYGFDIDPATAGTKPYVGILHPDSNNNLPGPVGGTPLPPTATGSVDLNICNGNGLRIKPTAVTSPSYQILHE